jgi:drug/metabolite transporter superfamily protein YnfA
MRPPVKQTKGYAFLQICEGLAWVVVFVVYALVIKDGLQGKVLELRDMDGLILAFVGASVLTIERLILEAKAEKTK